ncbi:MULTISPECIES: OmpA family protein [Pseudoalteromonas]|jgi:outer membrane protein OmpA-like peptidoglycan-associated protein|uniref:OmpA family protein n=1 Tax=Pseudoalteromonas lipolytica TaxID=570156 RepID=A0ABU8SNN1_9GAMM|nr:MULTISPECIES: OmpA family protein [unclassified Pseudoalteromonas]MBC7007589.1 OmpA family protein [Pseudoalteromonas sp. BZK2]MCF2914837.1 OmpA family protein [Pseudoalteromonas sp. Cn5-37]NHH89438.1 Outer membrane porin F [Pseudoalteromonas sp. MB47]TMP19136.1 OmpA family protein [Pseudoalteromonas sp. S2721]TMP45987.1 OmpA family protein [Pseudoalteromonas sp. S1650]|tara:strand:+ start:776 stop:1633 length:858 start_codon:yes stop_codon:yes gene_type:complete
MKHILITVLLIIIGGCASWPDEGQGGWAEKYQNYPLTDEQNELIYDTQETVVLSEFEHHVLKLDLLKAQGIKQCMPAQLLKAQIYENRIRRLIAAQMWEDAEHDLLIHYHGLNQLSKHFETVNAMTQCAGPTENEQVMTASLKEQITELLNSDNQFSFNDFQVTPKYISRLSQAADLIKQVDKINLLLVGHTDISGQQTNNYELALKRAETVKHWLGIYGVNPATITTLTQGSLSPYSNEPDSNAKRHSDRRVEAIVIDITDKDTNKKVHALSSWTKVLNGPKGQ